MVLGFFYLQFSPQYYQEYPQALGGLVNGGLPWWAGFGTDWLDTTSVYGPAFQLATEPVALAAGSSADAAAWISRPCRCRRT